MQESSSKDDRKAQDVLKFDNCPSSQDSQRWIEWRGGKSEHERELNVQSKWFPQ